MEDALSVTRACKLEHGLRWLDNALGARRRRSIVEEVAVRCCKVEQSWREDGEEGELVPCDAQLPDGEIEESGNKRSEERPKYIC